MSRHPTRDVFHRLKIGAVGYASTAFGIVMFTRVAGFSSYQSASESCFDMILRVAVILLASIRTHSCLWLGIRRTKLLRKGEKHCTAGELLASPSVEDCHRRNPVHLSGIYIHLLALTGSAQIDDSGSLGRNGVQEGMITSVSALTC